jgi:uncharacterized protein YdeI (BOF family)
LLKIIVYFVVLQEFKNQIFFVDLFRKLIVSLICLFIFMSLKSQDDFNIVKIDNSEYPYIEISIRANESFEAELFYILENDEEADYQRDTILLSKEKKNLSVLFVLNENPESPAVKSLIKTIRTLSEKDKINVAFLLDEDSTNRIFHYISPVFSENHDYFIHYLEHNIMNAIYYEVKKDKSSLKAFEQTMFLNQAIHENKGIIFIGDKLHLTDFSNSIIFTDKTTPVYILLFTEPEESQQDKLIELCMESGGIYTIISEDETEKHLNKYLEDISLHVSNMNSRLYRLLFKSAQSKEKNYFTIRYKEFEEQYIFTKPPGYSISIRERVLIAISIVLFVLIIVLILFFGRSGKKQRKTARSIAESLIFSDKSKPIEINVKTEGFNKTYFFEKHIIKIGRSSDNDIIIPDRTVSGSHAIINKEGDSYMVQDAGSTNGIFVNQKKVKKQKLKSKDKIKLGSATLIFRIPK